MARMTASRTPEPTMTQAIHGKTLSPLPRLETTKIGPFATAHETPAR